MTISFVIATHCKDGTVGKSFRGVHNQILNPDPNTGEGEVIARSRNVFMGYVKVKPGMKI